jgi:signal recognition particle subunit SRP54
MKKNQFTLEDFLDQMKMVRKMGSITSLGSMIPGMGKMMKDVDPEQAESELKRVEAIILSMTPKERRNHGIINGSRRKRIAKGSGTSVQEVNRLLKQFTQMKKMMKKLTSGGIGNLMGMLGGGNPMDMMKNMK